MFVLGIVLGLFWELCGLRKVDEEREINQR